MSGHTNGPWEYARGHILQTERTELGQMRIAKLCGRHHESFANARLIAAAPELLEALRLVTEMADAVGAVAGEVFGVESEPAVLARRNVELAKAAIAKAEGRES